MHFLYALTPTHSLSYNFTYSEGSQVCNISCRQKHVACYIINHVIQMLHSFLPAHFFICQATYKLEKNDTLSWPVINYEYQSR